MTEKLGFLILRVGEDFRKGAGVSADVEQAICVALCRFLTDNGLARSALPLEPAAIRDGFEIRSTDLTEEGIAVLKIGESRWLAGIDRGKDPADVRTLMSALKKIRGPR